MDDPNKRNHVFGNPEHNLHPLVQQYGSEEAAGQAIVEAVNEAARDGSLIIDTLGHYRQTLNIGGNLVTVSGKVVHGVPRVGSAWIRPQNQQD
jgi:hypothetical protein